MRHLDNRRHSLARNEGARSAKAHTQNLIAPVTSDGPSDSQPMPEAALGAFYDRYAPTVYALARHILGTGERAEAVTEDVFVRCWHKLDVLQRLSTDNPEQVSQWLRWLTHGLALAALYTVEMRDHTPDGERRRARPSTARPLQIELVVELALYAGLSCVEIAALTAATPEGVARELRLALRRCATPGRG